MRNVIIAALILLCGCRKPAPMCASRPAEIPMFVAFAHFTPADLDTVIVSYYYPADSTFSQLQETDTLLTPAVYSDGYYEFRNDSADNFAASAYFLYASTNDAIIYLPATGEKFYLHPVYSTDTVIYYPCGGRTFTASPTVFVNGRALAPVTDTGAFYNSVFITP